MKKLQKGLKLVGLGLLIILACLGVGISGAAPVLPRNKENNILEINIELTDQNKDDSETMIQEYFKK